MDQNIELDSHSEITKDSSLEQIQSHLVTEANSALGQFTFKARNEKMAKAVGLESSLLTARSIKNPEAALGLEGVFTSAAEESGKAFQSAFDETGKKLEDQDEAYNKAMGEAGEIALHHLPIALETAGITGVDVQSLLRDASFSDILDVTAGELGLELTDRLTADQIRRTLHDTAKGDYFEDQIDSLPFGDGKSLSDQEKKALDVAVRLANATWKTGQVHRAAWEGNNGRIDPNKREAFNPYDLLKKAQYDRLIQEGRTPQEALTRVSLEVYKDIIQYKPLVEINSNTPTVEIVPPQPTFTESQTIPQTSEKTNIPSQEENLTPEQIESRRRGHFSRFDSAIGDFTNGRCKTMEEALEKWGLTSERDQAVARILLFDLDGTTVLPTEELNWIKATLTAIKIDRFDLGLKMDLAKDTPSAIADVVYNLEDRVKELYRGPKT